MSERRVVITGIGCISPLGNDLDTTWEGLKAGRSGISTITQIDPSPFDCKIAGEVKNFEPDGYFGVPKDARRADRYVQFAVAASKMAMSDSGVVVRSGQQQYRAYSHTGTLRWTAEVELTGGPSDKPMVLPNGLIILQGANDAVCLSPGEGKVEWRDTRS